MTEQGWLTGTDPLEMFAFVEAKAADRKLRLFLAGCARAIWAQLARNDLRTAVEVAEEFAEGRASEDDLRDQNETLWDFFGREATKDQKEFAWGNNLDTRSAYGVALKTTSRRLALKSLPRSYMWDAGRRLTEKHQAPLLRCIFGNPFRPVALHRSWLTPMVTNLAQTIYDARELPSGLFDNHLMGVLGDVLEEGGCDNQEILDHCRSGGNHVRGCWIVDLLRSVD